MASRARLVLMISVIAAATSGAVTAQNLVVNPNFDVDLSGWSGIGVWSPFDAMGSPSSGSATWINDWPIGGGYYLEQCVELVPFFEGYDLSG